MADKNFSKKLKDLRIRAGLTQKQVYEHFNIPQSTFSSWEIGKSEPSGEMLIKLCNFYKCDMLKEFAPLNDSSITYDEYNYIQKYRELDAHGKEMVDFTLEKEWERSTALAEKESGTPDYLKPQAAHNDHMDGEDELGKVQNDLAMLDAYKKNS